MHLSLFDKSINHGVQSNHIYPRNLENKINLNENDKIISNNEEVADIFNGYFVIFITMQMTTRCHFIPLILMKLSKLLRVRLRASN